jgi:hypothetical protein
LRRRAGHDLDGQIHHIRIGVDVVEGCSEGLALLVPAMNVAFQEHHSRMERAERVQGEKVDNVVGDEDEVALGGNLHHIPIFESGPAEIDERLGGIAALVGYIAERAGKALVDQEAGRGHRPGLSAADGSLVRGRPRRG